MQIVCFVNNYIYGEARFKKLREQYGYDEELLDHKHHLVWLDVPADTFEYIRKFLNSDIHHNVMKANQYSRKGFIMIFKQRLAKMHANDAAPKDYLRITVYNDGTYNIEELTKNAYEKIFDKYNTHIANINGLGNGQCWIQGAFCKVILCKKEFLEIMKKRFNLDKLKLQDSSYKGYDIEYKSDFWQIWKDTPDGDTKIAGDFPSEEEAREWIDAQETIQPLKKNNELHKYDVYYIDNDSDTTRVEYDVLAKSEADAKRIVKNKYGKSIYGYPVDAILTDSKKEIKDMDRIEEIKNWLSKYLVKKSDPKNKLGKSYIRALKEEERLPNGVYHKAGTDNSGILHYKGKDYYWYLDNNDKIIIEDSLVHDSMERFLCLSYFDEKRTGVEDSLQTNDLDQVKDWLLNKSNKGYIVRAIDNLTGEVWDFKEIEDPEELNKIQPWDEEEELFEEDFKEPEGLRLWIVSWIDNCGYKHTIEFDSEIDAKQYVDDYTDNEDYHNIQITKTVKTISDAEDCSPHDSLDQYENNKNYDNYKLRELADRFNCAWRIFSRSYAALVFVKKSQMDEALKAAKEAFPDAPDQHIYQQYGDEIAIEWGHYYNDGSYIDKLDADWRKIEDSKIGDIIKKESDGYVIYSEKGKRLSKPFKTKEKAEKRLKQIEMFKHLNDEDDSEKIMDVLSKCQNIVKKHLLEENIDPEDAQLEIRHESKDGKDMFILSGDMILSGSKIESKIINEVLELLIQTFGYDKNISFDGFEDSVGGIFIIEE